MMETSVKMTDSAAGSITDEKEKLTLRMPPEGKTELPGSGEAEVRGKTEERSVDLKSVKVYKSVRTPVCLWTPET